MVNSENVCLEFTENVVEELSHVRCSILAGEEKTSSCLSCMESTDGQLGDKDYCVTQHCNENSGENKSICTGC